MKLYWPESFTALDHLKGFTPQMYVGSLLDQKRNASGTEFKRNRVYDPKTGRFTQEDPIGLAGGLNLYGFANGDPVNFSDPFGLCPYFLTRKPCSTVTAIGVGFIPVGGDLLEIAGAALGRDLLTGESLSGFAVGATVIGTLVGSGKLAREGVGLAGRALRGVPLPALDATGKLHGELPSHIPGSWTGDQLDELAGDLRSSVSARKLEQGRLGEHGPHRRRIFEEERLLRQIEKRLSGS